MSEFSKNKNVKKKDVFICHASEDKIDVINPLIENLKDNNISFWVDTLEINWGDSITQKVNDGLKKSTFAIVVLSISFLQKNWPKRELNALLNIEASSGEVKVLPLIYGNSEEIISELPLINDKKFLSWDDGIDNIIKELLNILNKDSKNNMQSEKQTKITTNNDKEKSNISSLLENKKWAGISGTVGLIGLAYMSLSNKPPASAPLQSMSLENKASIKSNQQIAVQGNIEHLEIHQDSDGTSSDINNCEDHLESKVVTLKIGEERNISNNLTIKLNNFDFENLSCGFTFSSNLSSNSLPLEIGANENKKNFEIGKCDYDVKLLDSNNSQCKFEISSPSKEVINHE